MAKSLNVAKFTAAASGTGNFTVSAAVTGFQTPALAGCVDGLTYRYRAESADLTQWEIGYGVASSSGTVFARTFVLYNSSGTGLGNGQSGAGTKINFSAKPNVGIVLISDDLRERLDSARTIYVGASLGAPTISIATPALASLTGHGLSAGDRVVFNVPRNTRSCTITSASPGVITINGHGLVANQPVQFHSTKYLPTGLTKGTTYYVVGASITANTFQVSATPGGAAVNTPAQTATFTNGSSTITIGANHNLVVGQIIQFSGTNVVNFSNATDYWVVSAPTATTITVSATPTGSAITAGAVTSNGTLVSAGNHYCSTVGALPTGITEGTTYFVQAAGLTANTFRVSTTSGGADVNTSGTVTGAPVYNVWTGNDSNNGLSATRSGALFTMNAAVSIMQTYDIGNFNCTMQLCPGYHSDQLNISKPFLSGTGQVLIKGDNSNTPLASNYIIGPGGGSFCIVTNHPSLYISVGGLRLAGAAAGGGLQSFGGTIYIYQMLDIACPGQQVATLGAGSTINFGCPVFVSAGAVFFMIATFPDIILCNQQSIFVDVPAYTYFAYANIAGVIQAAGGAHQGSATGQQWVAAPSGGGIDTSGQVGTLLGNAAGSTTSPGWKT